MKLAQLVLFALVLACGRDRDTRAVVVDRSGIYGLEVSPPSQSCGATATATFVADHVYLLATGDEEGPSLLGLWSDGSRSLGLLEGDRFTQEWTSSRLDELECPATGAATVRTSFTNAMTGTFGEAVFDAELYQTITDDCGVADCIIVWRLHGDRL